MKEEDTGGPSAPAPETDRPGGAPAREGAAPSGSAPWWKKTTTPAESEAGSGKTEDIARNQGSADLPLKRRESPAGKRKDAGEPAQVPSEVSEDLPFLKGSPAGKAIHGGSESKGESGPEPEPEEEEAEGAETSKPDRTKIDLEQLRTELKAAAAAEAEQVPPLTEPVPPPELRAEEESGVEDEVAGEEVADVEGDEETDAEKEEETAAAGEVADAAMAEEEPGAEQKEPERECEAAEWVPDQEIAEGEAGGDPVSETVAESDTAKVEVTMEEESGEEEIAPEKATEDVAEETAETGSERDGEAANDIAAAAAAAAATAGESGEGESEAEAPGEEEREMDGPEGLMEEAGASEDGEAEEKAEADPREQTLEKDPEEKKEEEEETSPQDSHSSRQAGEENEESGRQEPVMAAEKEKAKHSEKEGEDDPWFGDSYPIIPTETSLVAVEGKKGGGCWTVFATIFVIGTLLLVAALVGGAAYLWFKRESLMAKVEDTVREHIESRGYHFDHSGMGYQFPRGVVLEDFRLYTDETKERPVITFSDVGVDADMASLLKKGEKDAPLQGELSFSDSTITLHGGEGGDLTVEKVSGRVLASRASLRIETLRAPIAGAMVHVEGEVALASGSDAPPALPVSQSGLDRWKEWLAFDSEGTPPRIDLRIDADAAAPEAMKVTGRLTGSGFAWRGLAVDSASVPFEGDPSAQRWDSRGLLVSAAGGTVSGNVEIVDGVLRLGDVESTADFIQLSRTLWPEFAGKLGNFELVDNPRITATGAVPLDNPADCELALGVQHWKGLLAGGGEKRIPVSRLGGEIAIADRKAEFHEFRFALFDGDSAATGRVDFGGEGWTFDGMLAGAGVDLAEVAAAAGIDNRLLRGEGRFSFRGSGGEDISTWRGNGDLYVDGARLGAFPVVGPSQAFLGDLVPLFANQDQSRLGAHFQIESGVLITSDLEALSDKAGLKASGQVNLASKQTVFRATGYVMGELGLKTRLNEQPIAFEGKGDMNAPELAVLSYPEPLADASVQTALGMSAEAKAQVLAAFPPAQATEGDEDEGEESDGEDSGNAEESEPPGTETGATEPGGSDAEEQMAETDAAETEEAEESSAADDKPEPEPSPIRAQPIQAVPADGDN